MRIFAILFALAGLGMSMGADEYFTIGTAHLQIGQDQQAVLNYLRQLYEVHNSGGQTWVIAEKDAPGLKKVGVVTFEGGRLVTAGYNWNETVDASAVNFAKQLVNAVHNQQLTGPRSVILRPLQTNNGGSQSDGFELLIGGRTIQVMTSAATEGGKVTAQYATVMEDLHDPHYVAAVKQQALR